MVGRFPLKLQENAEKKGIGLEIQATYAFGHKKESKIIKLSELLNDKENKGTSYTESC